MVQANCFSGVELTRTHAGITLSQTKYATNILLDSGMFDATPVSSLHSHGIELTDPGKPIEGPKPFRRTIGRLMYLGFTRPDLSYATQQLSQYIQNPCTRHFQAATYLLRYLKGTLYYGLFYSSRSTPTVTGFCDADGERCKLSRKSIT